MDKPALVVAASARTLLRKLQRQHARQCLRKALAFYESSGIKQFSPSALRSSGKPFIPVLLRYRSRIMGAPHSCVRRFEGRALGRPPPIRQHCGPTLVKRMGQHYTIIVLKPYGQNNGTLCLVSPKYMNPHLCIEAHGLSQMPAVIFLDAPPPCERWIGRGALKRPSPLVPALEVALLKHCKWQAVSMSMTQAVCGQTSRLTSLCLKQTW